MIETITSRFTLARSPASCRLRTAAVKNSLAASYSGDGWVVASTIASTPASASARPSPLITSTPCEREIETTSKPRASSAPTAWRPTRPVAPATATLLIASMVRLLQ